VEIHASLTSLYRARSLFLRFPELHRLEDSVRERFLGPVLDWILNESGHVDPSAAIEHAWLASILEHLQVNLPALAAFDQAAQEAAVHEFVAVDKTHIEIAPKRVMRAWAERAVAARNEFPAEADQVSRQASLRRRHMPIRDLFDQAEHVLTSVKPCWVMSPLVVPQVLPSRQCFDVVIFDEASQIPPADAACSLLRGVRAVVAGDPHQLPPTAFFVSGTDDDDDDLETENDDLDEDQLRLARARSLSLTQGQESILDVLMALLPPPYGTSVLSWHYRSRDERLITFSNAQESLYGWSLTTFPGAFLDRAISHELVPFRPGIESVPASASAEVTRVVELITEHLLKRPAESLGVIALGVKHATLIEEALRQVSLVRPEVATALEEPRDEQLFIKNLERVQGDERDAIILTVGYAKTDDGRMRYNFGPINQEGGQRRLNVAITRARRRLTLVSSFSANEMDPERLRSVGAQMLRDFLLYAESNGTNLGLRARPKSVLNPFERDVQQQLENRGVIVIPQYGASSYWIDFAAMHPDRRSEPVLAIETDGVMYHSSETARNRDRLRQEHLERLGWKFHRIWSTNWFRYRESELDRAVEAYQGAVGDRDGLHDETAGHIKDDTEDDTSPPDWLLIERGRSNPSREPWPGINRGLPIDSYSVGQLLQVVRWVKSNGRLYTEVELLSEVMDALGFRKRGSRIVGAIRAAIRAGRQIA
jgi:hypothetical protein